MPAHFKDKKFLLSPNIDGEPGWFSVEHPLSFEKCRERFAVHFTHETTGFYFMHPPGWAENVAAFVHKTEEILEIQQDAYEFSTFAMTNRERILWIEPSGFWKVCSLRRSLLTLILRAGMVYDVDKDNYEDAVFNQEHLRRTKKAIMRFLYGFTCYTGESLTPSPGATLIQRGWVAVFESKDEFFIKDTLVLPKSKTPIPISLPDMEEALWF